MALALWMLLADEPNLIDRHLPVEKLCDDAAFLRRATLDLGGTVPSVEQARRFLNDASPDKRRQLIEELLSGERYPRRWARVWTRHLTDRRGVGDEEYSGYLLAKHLEQTLARNTPFDAMARELITATGPAFDNGASNFILRYRANPVDLAGGISRVFLGIRLQCAQCHDHPFAAWKQAQFWGLAAFFARTRSYYIEDYQYGGVVDVKRGGRMATPGLKTGEEPKGEDEEPESARIAATYLDGRPGAGGRVSLAEAITDPARSPTFALNAVNRVWASLFGRGLVEPLDGFTLKETGEPPALLRELADAFVKKRYDLHWLLGTIASSRAYQKGAGAPVRPLDEDQIVEAIRDATGFHEEPEVEEEGMEKEDMMEAMEEAEAYQEEEAGAIFGAQAVSQTRALALLNSPFVHEAVEQGVRLCRAGNGRKIGPRHLEWLYLATLSRRPTADELKGLEELVAGSPAKSSRLEDILWALLNSAEFTSNH